MRTSPYDLFLPDNTLIDAFRDSKLPLVTRCDLRKVIHSRLSHTSLEQDRRSQERQFERIEKHGDAVLRCLVNRAIYEVSEEWPEATPHFVGICEAYLVSNFVVSRLCVGLYIHSAFVEYKDAGQRIDPSFASDRQVKTYADVFEAHLGALDLEGRMPELESWAIKVFGEFASILREDVRRRVQAFDSGPRKEASAQDRRGHASGDGPKRDLNRLAASVGFTVAYETVKRCLLTHHGDTRQAASITIVPGRKARDMDRELAKAAYITANGWWGTRRRRFEDGSLSEARKRPRNALDT